MSFTWQSAGHAFASLFKEVVTVSKKVSTALGGVKAEEKAIESLTAALVNPDAVVAEQIAFGLLGEIIAAVQASGTAAEANGLNVSFDATVIADVKKLIAAFPDMVKQVEAQFGKKAAA